MRIGERKQRIKQREKSELKCLQEEREKEREWVWILVKKFLNFGALGGER